MAKFLVPTPITFVLFPFLILGFVLNSLIIWLFLSNKKVGFGKSFVSSLISYLILAVFGLCITFYANVSANFLWFLVYYLLAIIIEWLVLMPYFREFQFRNFKLLLTSIIGNTVIFAILTYMVFYKTGVIDHYINLVKIALQEQGITF